MCTQNVHFHIFRLKQCVLILIVSASCQMDVGQSFLEFILEDVKYLVEWRKKGIGTGHAKSGTRKRWKKQSYFESDLLSMFERDYPEAEFKARFAGHSPRELRWFFNTIKAALIRPRETWWHAQNKLLLWLQKLHHSLSGLEMKHTYKIGISTAYSYVEHVVAAILQSYENEDVIRFPSIPEREQMVRVLKARNALLPHAVFALDGSHARCTGRHIRERLSFKYRWLPCFNVLFVTERVLNTVCAFSLDQRCRPHDMTILREAPFFRDLNETMQGWIILADKGLRYPLMYTSAF